jgi:hypothetical protein
VAVLRLGGELGLEGGVLSLQSLRVAPGEVHSRTVFFSSWTSCSAVICMMFSWVWFSPVRPERWW